MYAGATFDAGIGDIGPRSEWFHPYNCTCYSERICTNSEVNDIIGYNNPLTIAGASFNFIIGGSIKMSFNFDTFFKLINGRK